MLVGLAVGEPMKLRADEELDLGARTCREGGALESALASPDHHDPARAVGAVVLEIGRKPDAFAHCLGQRRRRVRERDSAHGQHDVRTSASEPAAVVTRNVPLDARSTEVTAAGSAFATKTSRNQAA